MNYYKPKKSVPILPLLIVPVILVVAFTYVNFIPCSSKVFSILDFFISLSYILLWGLLFYFTWKSKSIMVPIIYCGMWILCFSIVLLTFLLDMTQNDINTQSFFSTGFTELKNYIYSDYYTIDYNNVNFSALLSIVPLSGVFYIVGQFCTIDTTISALYITILCISSVFILTSIVLTIRAIRVHFEDKKLENTLKIEEEEYKQRHKYE